MDLSTLRRRPYLLAVVATATALVAALLSAAVVSAVTHDGGRKVEATLRLSDPDKDPQAQIEGDKEGKAFPTTSLAKLAGGLSSIAAYRGKPVVVNFFASWCTECITEMPALQKVHGDLGDKIAFVGIDVRDATKDAQGFVRRTGVAYDILRDPAGQLTADVGVINLPATFLVSPSGRVVAEHPGAFKESDLRAQIAKYFQVS